MRTMMSQQEQDLLWELRAEGLPLRVVGRRMGSVRRDAERLRRSVRRRACRSGDVVPGS
jgi:hypothetical protein